MAGAEAKGHLLLLGTRMSQANTMYSFVLLCFEGLLDTLLSFYRSFAYGGDPFHFCFVFHVTPPICHSCQLVFDRAACGLLFLVYFLVWGIY